GRDDAGREADDRREDHRAHGELERVRHAVQDLGEHGTVRTRRLAEAAVEDQALHESRVLHGQGLVETELGADGRDVISRRRVAREHRRGIAGDERGHEEHAGRDAEEHGDREDEAAERIAPHLSAALRRYFFTQASCQYTPPDTDCLRSWMRTLTAVLPTGM